MTNERLEFLRQWHQDTQARETVWSNLLFRDIEGAPHYGIPYTRREIMAVLYALTNQRLEIEREIKQSKENLR